ncbi:hypothetical protein FQN60_018583, partial [Etheostoma spectabile]
MEALTMADGGRERVGLDGVWRETDHLEDLPDRRRQGRLSVCKELQLPSSEYNYTADLVAVSSAAPLETAAVQSISVLALSVEGTARLWPSLAQEGNYTETSVDLGDLCNFVVAVRGGSFVLSSEKSRLLRASVDPSGKLQYRALQQGQGVLSGIGRRVSSLFGILSPPANDTATPQRAVGGRSRLPLHPDQLQSDFNTVNVFHAHTKTDFSTFVSRQGSESNYEELKEGANVTYLDMKLSQAGLVVLAAAWHPSDTPCLAYFCLVTLQDTGAAISDHFTVEVTKYNPPFQALQATRLVLPRSPGSSAFLYNEETVFACSTGTSRGAPPDEKISFNSPGDGVRGGGCCADLPVFFSLNSGLVAVVARESASILPETMEDSLCSSLAPEVSAMETPTRSEPVAQEDKTKLLKAAFLHFCRYESGSGFPLTSLIILHQLEDKMKAHGCFMDFLLQVGLLDRLGRVTVRSSPMATRLLLCEHAEKLQAAMVLKNHHGKHCELVNRAIATALQKSGAAVSQISSVFECLLDEEERSLKESPDMLQAATSGGVGGVRSVLSRQHEVILRSVYPHADSELRSALCEQLVALLDIYLGGYVAQLTSLQQQRPPGAQQERYNSLEM